MRIVDRIIEHKRARLARQKELMPLDDLRRKLESVEARRSEGVREAVTLRSGGFIGAITSRPIGLIAEVKRASPSAGVIVEDYRPGEIAAIYKENGAVAVSVLTEEDYFLGAPEHIAEVRAGCGLPVLRKDFIIDEYQIYESCLLGADAVLLIVRYIDFEALGEMVRLAKALDLAALVEVHGREELDRALDVGAELIGINNRDLGTLKVDLETTFRLIRYVPDGVTVVSESGISRREDVLRLKSAGVDGVLVGEAILRSEDVGAKVRELLGR